MKGGYCIDDFENVHFAVSITDILTCNFVCIKNDGVYEALLTANSVSLPANINKSDFNIYGEVIVNSNCVPMQPLQITKPKLQLKKVASVESVDTLSPTQLNNLISTFNIDLPMAGKKNIKAASRKFFLTHTYQQQLAWSPLNINLYCFDNQAAFVCMFQDLIETQHEIIVSNKQKELYEFDTIKPNFDDYRKVLL